MSRMDFSGLWIVLAILASLSFVLQAAIVLLLYRIHSSLSSGKGPEPESVPMVEPESEPEPELKPEPEQEQEPEQAPVPMRDRILKGIQACCGRALTDSDLPFVREKLSTFFAECVDGSFHRFLDLRPSPDARIVVIGDIHSDPVSLAGILLKLSVADYDYFGKATFVFLGDYFDRGFALLETLLLLADLKSALGERMILLKGNHETIGWNEAAGCLTPHVIPHESCVFLGRRFSGDRDFLHSVADFCKGLPIYVYVKTAGRDALLVHAAIPRDIFFRDVRLDGNDGSLVFADSLSPEDRLSVMDRVFKDMIWGDPSSYEEKFQMDGRFQFGRRQFERWAAANGIGLLLRSHEEAATGVTPFYDGRLYTVFSTGGSENDSTGYPGVEPAFCILGNDLLLFENNFIYTIRDGSGPNFIHAISRRGYSDRQVAKFHLDAGFACDKSVCREVMDTFDILRMTVSNEQ